MQIKFIYLPYNIDIKITRFNYQLLISLKKKLKKFKFLNVKKKLSLKIAIYR